jgi:hypothetical protein
MAGTKFAIAPIKAAQIPKTGGDSENRQARDPEPDAAMMLITAVIVTRFKYSQNRSVRLSRGLGIISGMVSPWFV